VVDVLVWVKSQVWSSGVDSVLTLKVKGDILELGGRAIWAMAWC
jgi:hypothetical protein